jgi:hypothetical protein
MDSIERINNIKSLVVKELGLNFYATKLNFGIVLCVLFRGELYQLLGVVVTYDFFYFNTLLFQSLIKLVCVVAISTTKV